MTNLSNETLDATASVSQLLLSPRGIRQRAQQIYQLALDGKTHFEIHEHKLAQVTAFVLDTIKGNYPSLQVPYHSRWRHFEVGDREQLNRFNHLCKNLNALDRARLGLDLILPSVLVDAGAGPDWTYGSRNSAVVGRSEGLGLASLDLFLAGGLSDDKSLSTTAQGLMAISQDQFEQAFKVTQHNPLLGVPGRVQLLRSLGEAMLAQPDIFPNGRPGDLVDYVQHVYGGSPTAEDILHMVLHFFGGIWPGRLSLEGYNLGDTWVYQPLGSSPANYVPFHKLSQWISYSVIETLVSGGIEVRGVEALTGLAEYRNGGLMLDSGLICLRDPTCAQMVWSPANDIIIEWRALTVCLLDRIAAEITAALNTTSAQFPLAKVLEGGTWAAGRKLALLKRNNLSPPLHIVSDATVF